MQLVIKNGKVVATYDDNVEVFDLYDLSEYEVVNWSAHGIFVANAEGDLPDDPRTPAQKFLGAKRRYLLRRRRAYPSVRRCLRLIYRDMRDGTTEYVDAINAVNAQFPKPE